MRLPSGARRKTSFKVAPGGAPDVPASSGGMQVIKWLEMHGINFSRPVASLGG
jgi:hypothetical protein